MNVDCGNKSEKNFKIRKVEEILVLMIFVDSNFMSIEKVLFHKSRNSKICNKQTKKKEKISEIILPV